MSTAPLQRTIEASVPAVAAAADADQVIGTAPVAGTVTGVTYTPEANVTAHATESRTFSLINKGADGNGTTVVASLALDTPTTDDLADFDAKALTLSAVAYATDVVEGDVLAWVSTHVGTTGLADPGGKVTVTIERG